MIENQDRIGGFVVKDGAEVRMIALIIIIIIITRPKPAYGRQGLAGSWGQDTDEVSTLVFHGFRSVLMVFHGSRLV